MVRRDLAAIPVERLKDSTAGRLRFGPLASAGYVTVLDVLDATPSALLSVPGVGQQTATQIHAAARQVATAIEDGLKVRVDLDPGNVLSTSLLGRIEPARPGSTRGIAGAGTRPDCRRVSRTGRRDGHTDDRPGPLVLHRPRKEGTCFRSTLKAH